jgi:hypothetical protein
MSASSGVGIDILEAYASNQTADAACEDYY